MADVSGPLGSNVFVVVEVPLTGTGFSDKAVGSPAIREVSISEEIS